MKQSSAFVLLFLGAALWMGLSLLAVEKEWIEGYMYVGSLSLWICGLCLGLLAIGDMKIPGEVQPKAADDAKHVLTA